MKERRQRMRGRKIRRKEVENEEKGGGEQGERRKMRGKEA